MKILFFGDVVGKVGRQAVAKLLPEYKKKYHPDVIIANVENIAHGTGVTSRTLEEIKKAGVQFFTSGDHIFDKPEGEELVERKDMPLIRPANYPTEQAGQGYQVISVGAHKLAVINIIGQAFMKHEYASPFFALDEILQIEEVTQADAIFVDFHAEATSEKTAIGHYADGRVAAVVGTHTHVPTADCKTLPGGTAYVTDVGMCGAQDSVIGVEKESAVNRFINEEPSKFVRPESGIIQVNAVLIEVDIDKKSSTITRVDTTTEI